MFPDIEERYPTQYSGAQSAARPEIVLVWTTGLVETEFSSAANLAKYIQLQDELTSAQIPLEFVSYVAATRTITLRPTLDLSRGREFRVILKSGVLSTEGRRSRSEYQWTFLTAGTALGQVSLLAPGNESIQTVFPTLYWSAVSATGTILYQIEIDDRPDFGSIDYLATTTATSLTPAGSFNSETTWYWRVLALSGTTSGAYSLVRSFYFGTVARAHPTSDQTWLEAEIFGVRSTGFKDGISHLSSFPTSLSITFTSEPASSFSNYVTVTKKSVFPRNDQATTYSESAVTGSWAQSGNTITFTPGEDISGNTRYTIRIAQTLPNTDGETLNDEVWYTFSGVYSPYYCDIATIRSRFLTAALHIPDDVINLYIFHVSLEANARYYGYFGASNMLPEGLSETLVRDQPKLRSFGVGKWVESMVVFRVLKSLLFEGVPSVGLTRQLGDYKESLSDDFRKALMEAMKAAKEEVEQFENYLVPSDMPRTGGRMEWWDSSNWDADLFMRHLESHRDDWWNLF